MFLIFSCTKKKEILNAPTSLKVKYNESDFSFNSDTLFYKNEKFSGLLFDINLETGDSLLSINYLEGKLNGISKKWYPNGHIMEHRVYENNQKNGSQKSYWQNGKKRFVYNAIKDIQEGEMKEWDENGKLSHLGNYKNGQEEGEQKMWYDTGKIKANYVIKNGRRYGLLGTKNCRNVSAELDFNPE